MARRASHDLFEAVEHERFSEDQARTIFRQIGESDEIPATLCTDML